MIGYIEALENVKTLLAFKSSFAIGNYRLQNLFKTRKSAINIKVITVIQLNWLCKYKIKLGSYINLLEFVNKVSKFNPRTFNDTIRFKLSLINAVKNYWSVHLTKYFSIFS